MRATVLHIQPDASLAAAVGAERAQNAQELEGLLLEDRLANAYLLHRAALVAAGVSRPAEGEAPDRWLGVRDPIGRLIAAALVRRGGIGEPAMMCCPVGTVAGCEALGQRVALDGGALIMVGPRESADAAWHGMGSPPFRVAYDQRLYAAEAASAGPRLAVGQPMRAELDQLVDMDLGMLEDDLGIAKERIDIDALEDRVLARLEAGKLRVARRDDGQLNFLIDVSRCGAFGAQLGGTYVPPEARGRGICTRAVRSVLDELCVGGAPVTLHVNEANEAAWRAYERAGMRPVRPFRLFSV